MIRVAVRQLDPSSFLREWYYRSLNRRLFYGEECCQCIAPGTPQGILCRGCNLALERTAAYRLDESC